MQMLSRLTLGWEGILHVTYRQRQGAESRPELRKPVWGEARGLSTELEGRVGPDQGLPEAIYEPSQAPAGHLERSRFTEGWVRKGF